MISIRNSSAGRPTTTLLALCLALVITPAPVPAQQEEGRTGFVLGKVYEVDKAAYRRYIESMRASTPDFDEGIEDLDAERFLEERAGVNVSARQLASNETFASGPSNRAGDYTIRESPVGTFGFTLLHEGLEYPVQQRLDLNVELSYVAELCFVIDREEQVAWMVTNGARRTEDVPPWVPRQCVSALSACLAMLTDSDGRFPDGLLLYLAAGGAAATALGLGLGPADQVEASPVVPPPQ